MGIDQRTNEPTHSDSMIVLHVVPSTHHVTMLSIPRDLWVSIPSPTNAYGSYKINAAYTLGQPYGQGPQFAQLVVESALGIPLNYYAVLKFSGFKSVVDAMGGVTVCVPRELYDPTYPNDVGYGWHTIDVKAGCQKMDGSTALVYARERHADAEQDLGRIQQQQVLLAGVEKQLLSPGTVLRAPAILSAMDRAVLTNLPHDALPELGVLLGRARAAQTQHAYINADGGYVTDTTSTDGQNILAGNWPKINALVARLFADPQLQAEHATVQVRNGQHTPGLAALYTTILQGAGFTTVAPRNADRDTYRRNLVIVNQDLPGADYTARTLTQMLQADVSYRHLGPDHARIVVILGADAVEGT
jgi:LCP family protein required for cell wall assembly